MIRGAPPCRGSGAGRSPLGHDGGGSRIGGLEYLGERGLGRERRPAGVPLVGRHGSRGIVCFNPGGHDGFLGGEFGQMGKPDEFAVRLTEVLAAT